MRPAISVIIPVYNVEAYLRECLDSVVSQSLQNIEIICVNDGSTDHSADILTEYAAKDLRIRIITQKNGGLSAARNAGLAEATGTYCIFPDSDDLFYPDALKKMYVCSVQNQLDLLLFNKTSFYEPGVPPDPFEDRPCDQYRTTSPVAGTVLFFEASRCSEWQCCIPYRIYNTDFLKQNKLLFHNGVIHEDEAYSIATDLLASRAMRLTEPFYKRRVRAGSIMTGMSAKRHIDGCLTAYNDIAAFMVNHTFSKEICEYVRRRQECLLISAGRYMKDFKEEILFDGMPLAERVSLAEEYIQKAELEDEKAGRSLFQKIMAPLRCLRENGIRCTLNRVFRGKKS